MARVRLGILGIGKIARDQHILAVRASADFELIACASRNAKVDGISNFPTLEAMLDGAAPEAVAICTPPQAHFDAARLALRRGVHVLLEKPPCLTTAELAELEQVAHGAKKVLFQTWHSRHAAGVSAAQTWLESRTIRSGRIVWKEDVRRWHPGQTWIWQAGGFGVFDPAINAFSILTKIVPGPVFAKRATLFVPENCETPIAADVDLATQNGATISAALDFRHEGEQTWDIELQTDSGTLRLSEGGGRLFIDGKPVAVDNEGGEYPSIYRHFAALLALAESDVDAAPFRLVADIFLIGKKVTVERFDDPAAAE